MHGFLTFDCGIFKCNLFKIYSIGIFLHIYNSRDFNAFSDINFDNVKETLQLLLDKNRDIFMNSKTNEVHSYTMRTNYDRYSTTEVDIISYWITIDSFEITNTCRLFSHHIATGTVTLKRVRNQIALWCFESIHIIYSVFMRYHFCQVFWWNQIISVFWIKLHFSPENSQNLYHTRSTYWMIRKIIIEIFYFKDLMVTHDNIQRNLNHVNIDLKNDIDKQVLYS